MKAMSHTTIAERTGRWLGRMWRNCVRQEARAIQWLTSKGLPAGVGPVLFWIIKLTVFGLLLYAAFWLALVLAFVVVAAWLARNADLENDHSELEWPFMTEEELRNSMFYDPVAHNDTTHPDYKDD
jgi:hypothetical protein